MVSVMMDISAPHVILPEDFSSEDSSLVSGVSGVRSVSGVRV